MYISKALTDWKHALVQIHCNQYYCRSLVISKTFLAK